MFFELLNPFLAVTLNDNTGENHEIQAGEIGVRKRERERERISGIGMPSWLTGVFAAECTEVVACYFMKTDLFRGCLTLE